MCEAHGSIEYHIRDDRFLGDIHATIAFILKWMHTVLDNTEDRIRIK